MELMAEYGFMAWKRWHYRFIRLKLSRLYIKLEKGIEQNWHAIPVRENNIRARKAYLSCGFTEKGRYVKKNGVAVIMMEKYIEHVNH